MKIKILGSGFTHVEVCETPEGNFIFRLNTKNRLEEIDFYDTNDSLKKEFFFQIEGDNSSRVEICTTTKEEYQKLTNIMLFERENKNEHWYLFLPYNSFHNRKLVVSGGKF